MDGQRAEMRRLHHVQKLGGRNPRNVDRPGLELEPLQIVADPDFFDNRVQSEFLRAAASQFQAVNGVLQSYALELKGTVARDFTAPESWTPELMRRLATAGVKIAPANDSAARVVLSRDLANRVARMSFGDAAAKSRLLPEDHQLLRAVELLEKSTTQAQLLAAASPAQNSARK